jgi:redox-sensitive bicupin YhaK (pirin superfamily)
MATAASTMIRSSRKIVGRTRGSDMGVIARVLGPWVQRQAPYKPSELAELLKPFVFLDIFSTTEADRGDLRLHPHSGLATLTYLMGGNVQIEDTTGKTGLIGEGGVEWFHAGEGAWHGGGASKDGPCRGYQLWVALPPEQELGEVKSVYLPKDEVPHIGPATVLLGGYQGVVSPLRAPSDLTYLAVRLQSGEKWRYEPPIAHTVCFVALGRGTLKVPETIDTGEFVAFEPSNGSIEFEAATDVEFVLGSAVRHPYPLSLGHYSVHTCPEALRKGEARIEEIRQRLLAGGRLSAS